MKKKNIHAYVLGLKKFVLATLWAVCYTFMGSALAGEKTHMRMMKQVPEAVLQERKHMDENNHMEVRK